MSPLLSLFLLGALALVHGHHGDGKPGYVDINTGVTISLLAGFDSDDNAFFSPALLSNGLLLLANGAGGETRTELLKFLDLQNDEDLQHLNLDAKRVFAEHFKNLPTGKSENKNLTINFNAKMIADSKSLTDEFKKLATETYDVNVEDALNFAVNGRNITKDINRWVAEKTNNRIARLLDDNFIDPSIKLLLLNAVYFKGAWAKPFDAQDTYQRDFYNFGNTNSTTKLDFMTQTSKFRTLNDPSNTKAKAIEIAFKKQSESGVSHSMSLVVMMPTEGHVDNLTERLTTKMLNDFLVNLGKTQPSNTKLTMPKLRLEKDYELKGTLEESEVKKMFSSEADFGSMFKNAGAEKISIANIVHKAVVEWTEHGAEAAAATAVKIVTSSLPVDTPPEFNVDRPFLFFIIDHNEQPGGTQAEAPLIVFAGRAKTLINEAALTTGLNY